MSTTAGSESTFDRRVHADDGAPVVELRDKPASVPKEFRLALSSATLSAALVHVAGAAGWSCRQTEGDGTITVTDTPRAVAGDTVARRRILMVEPTPFGASAGVRAMYNGTATAVVSGDRPDDLVPALCAVSDGWGIVPVRVMELAAAMPDLSERQIVIIQAVIAGQGNRDIARGLYLSDTSIKRELAGLFRSLGTHNRLSLAARAGSLGFESRRLSP